MNSFSKTQKAKLRTSLFTIFLLGSFVAGCKSSVKNEKSGTNKVDVPADQPPPVARSFGSPDPVHIVKPYETVWFLANIYYKDPHRYMDILLANDLSTENDLKVGQQLRILDPLYLPDDTAFEERFARLLKKRNEKLQALRQLKQNPAAPIEQRLPASK